MTVWLNGTHGAGKTTTSALVQQLLPDSRVFDAEKVGETLMDITPGLPRTDNFPHWPPWRPLVVETARRVLDYTGGTLLPGPPRSPEPVPPISAKRYGRSHRRRADTPPPKTTNRALTVPGENPLTSPRNVTR